MRTGIRSALQIAFVLILAAPQIVAAEDACDRSSRGIAVLENSIRNMDEYIRNQSPGYYDLQKTNDERKVELARIKEEYRQRCEGPKGGQPGGQATSQPGRRPEENNPFSMPNGATSDPNNPFSMPNQAAPAPNEPVAEQPDKAGAVAFTAGRVEPPKDFDGKPCNYFTKERTSSSPMAMYPDGSYICFQDRMYECINRYWKARADCGAYDKNYVKRAEDIEKSTINTKIHEEE